MESIGYSIEKVDIRMYQFDKKATLPVRAILILLVVLGHSFDYIHLSNWSFAYPAVSVFLFISGFGLVRKYHSEKFSQMPFSIALQEFIKCCRKLLPIFAIISVVYAIYLRMFTCWTLDNLVQNIIEGSSFLPIPFMWYVPAIIVIYACFYLASVLSKSQGQFLLIMTILISAYWLVVAILFRWPFYWWKGIFAVVFGLTISLYEAPLRGFLSKHGGGYVAFSALMMMVFGMSISNMFLVDFIADHICYALLGVAVLLICYRVAINARLLNLIGSASYEIYIVHGIFVVNFACVFSDKKLMYLASVLLASCGIGYLISVVRKRVKMI